MITGLLSTISEYFVWTQFLRPFGLDATIHPMKFNVGLSVCPFELKDYMGRRRAAFREITAFKFVYIHRSYAALYFGRVAEVEDAEWSFHQVTAHIANGSGTVVPPATPVKGHELVYIIFIGSSTQPEVPV